MTLTHTKIGQVCHLVVSWAPLLHSALQHLERLGLRTEKLSGLKQPLLKSPEVAPKKTNQTKQPTNSPKQKENEKKNNKPNKTTNPINTNQTNNNSHKSPTIQAEVLASAGQCKLMMSPGVPIWKQRRNKNPTRENLRKTLEALQRKERKGVAETMLCCFCLLSSMF